MIREDTVEGVRRVTLEAGALVVSVLPELGGKIASLRLADGGGDVLLPPQDSPYRRAERGASFEAFDTSGFDECFPTVGACASDVRQVPYVGLWICQGGWPTSRDAKHFTVALEPCSGRPDALSDAAARGECRTLAPRGVQRWTLEVELRRGPPAR